MDSPSPLSSSSPSSIAVTALPDGYAEPQLLHARLTGRDDAATVADLKRALDEKYGPATFSSGAPPRRVRSTPRDWTIVDAGGRAARDDAPLASFVDAGRDTGALRARESSARAD